MALALVLNRRRQVPAEESPAFGAIAERFRRAGELDRAVALCQGGLQKYPKHLSSRVTLGWALLDLGRYDEARIELEQVLKRAPDNLAAIRGLAQLHDRTEHDDVASMQAGPSRWTAPEMIEEMPEVELEPNAGPWLGLETDTPLEADGPPATDHAPHVFCDDVSDVDALAAELLGPAPVVDRMVDRVSEDADWVAPAVAAVVAVPETEHREIALIEDDDRPWCDDGLELGAPEPEQAARALLELVPASRAANVDNEFVPDEGPGPWPPVLLDDDAPSGRDLLRLAPSSAERDAWPPIEERPPVLCLPAAEAFPEGSHFSAAMKKTGRTGLLSALGKFRRRIDSRRRQVVSQSVAG
jgi:tetratricopeptide (TPR) repeat protein